MQMSQGLLYKLYSSMQLCYLRWWS